MFASRSRPGHRALATLGGVVLFRLGHKPAAARRRPGGPPPGRGPLKRAGAFVPGVRAGRPTAEYLAYLRGRLAVVEVLGTGLVAVLPTPALTAVGAADGYGFSGASLLVAAGTALGAVGPLMRDVQQTAVLRRYAR
ncbi:hypothetical protein [Kitasatospora sp. NPDC056531]|uniref:hypothetical protein n=1 Tax=Kitasatospora sp. NPDC056531 TaxID=3345856 RepID=UPI00367CC5C2